MPTAPSNPSQPDDDEFLADVEDETDEQPSEETVEFDFSAADTPAPRPRPSSAPKKPKTSLKEIAVPLLFTVGVILLIPAIWGTLVLTGSIEEKRETAK